MVPNGRPATSVDIKFSFSGIKNEMILIFTLQNTNENILLRIIFNLCHKFLIDPPKILNIELLFRII